MPIDPLSAFEFAKTLFAGISAAAAAIGVLLASLAAGAITHHYKMLEQENALFAEAPKAATETSYDIIHTIGKRYFYGAASGDRLSVENRGDGEIGPV